MIRYFISRSLAADSPLRSWCRQQEIELVDQSLLKFEEVSFGKLPEAIDWIFFYSPRAVFFFWKNDPLVAAGSRLAAIGPGTAASLTDLGKEVDFIGTGDPATTAEKFEAVATGKRVLFPRAQQSRRSIERILGDKIDALDVVVYNNEQAPVAFPNGFKILILTSPLNVEAFFSENQLLVNSRIIALGPSTAAALSDLGYEAEQAAAPTEEALIELLAANR